MVPEDRVAVVAGTHDAILGQPETGEVGKVAMGHRGRPFGGEGTFKEWYKYILY